MLVKHRPEKEDWTKDAIKAGYIDLARKLVIETMRDIEWGRHHSSSPYAHRSRKFCSTDSFSLYCDGIGLDPDYIRELLHKRGWL